MSFTDPTLAAAADAAKAHKRPSASVEAFMQVLHTHKALIRYRAEIPNDTAVDILIAGFRHATTSIILDALEQLVRAVAESDGTFTVEDVIASMSVVLLDEQKAAYRTFVNLARLTLTPFADRESVARASEAPHYE